jgi:hypothetical protein
LLAVSGLGPAAGTDACSDNIGMLLAAVVGVEYDAAQWEASGCSAWQVEGEIDPASELTDLLLAISEEPFARDCRQP